MRAAEMVRRPIESLIDREIHIGIIFIPMLNFEFDASKSKANREKHGIDFVEAQQLWEDEDRLEITARTEDEPRYVLIAALSQKLWSAFFTYRKGSIRLISVRRSRKEEKGLYYESEESR